MALHFSLRRLLPSALLYLALLGAAIALDGLLHVTGQVGLGRFLGIAGTLAILVSFLYSLRKRKVLGAGSHAGLLKLHEVLGWVGAVMVVVHGGIHFNAVIPWLAVAAMLVVVASGFVGKYLLAEARASLKAEELELRSRQVPEPRIERELLGHSLLVATMKRWREVHMPLTMAFCGLALVHVGATLLLWGWR